MSFAITGKEKIVIYGAGERGKKFAELFCKRGFQVIAILDKRANEINVIKVNKINVHVINPEQYIVNSCNEVALISLWNGIYHDEVAEALFKIGFRKIIYLPLRSIKNKKSASDMRAVFNRIIGGQCFFDCIPEYKDIMEDSGINYLNGEHTIYMPVENLFSEEEYLIPLEELEGVELVKRKKIMEYAGENLANYNIYYQLFRYLDKAEGECSDYIDTQICTLDKKEDEQKRILLDRYRLFQIYEKEFATDTKFFIDSAPEVVWNKKGYYNIRDGHHRAMYLIYKGVWDVPVRVREEDKVYIELWNQIPNTFWCESPYMINREDSLFCRKQSAIISSAMLKKDIVGKRIYINLNDAGLLGRYCYRLGCELCIDIESEEAAKFSQKICDIFQFTDRLQVCTHLEYANEVDFAVIDEKFANFNMRILAHIYILKVEKEGLFYNNIRKNAVPYEQLGKYFDGEKEYLIIKLKNIGGNGMTNEIKEKWDLIVNQDTYIYGAAKTAEELYSIILKLGYKGIKGFLVTEGKDNPEELLGLPVWDVHDFNDKEVHILVPHLGVYKEQISSLLDSLGFKNVYLVGQLMTRMQLEENRNNVVEGGEVEVNEKMVELKKKNLLLQEQIFNILQEGSPDFGGVMPYQSMELIGLEGMRPTEYRIQEYGLREILKAEHDILDIGCNSGFLDMSIAGLVHSVTGIEYDKNLVKVAELVKEYLNIPNCTFVNGDFNEWCKEINITYNVIFSFAIHHWLNVSSQEYVKMLDKLLRQYGYICFESHIYGTDIEFDECYEEFKKIGYKTICDKKINDNGLQEREYLLLQKSND